MKKNHGFAVLESVGIILLAGLSLIVVLKALSIDRQFRLEIDDVDVVEGARAALIGYALTYRQLPRPVVPRPSSGRPGYEEGLLPVKILGLSSEFRDVQFIVQTELTKPPEIVDFDPENLLERKLPVRSTANILDFCSSLIGVELAGKSLTGGARAAFGVQMNRSVNDAFVSSGRDGSFYLESVGGGKTQPKSVVGRLIGSIELSSELNCGERLRDVFFHVKALAITNDVVKILENDQTYKQIASDKSIDDLQKVSWRLAAWSISEATFILRLALAVTALDDPESSASALIATVGLTAAIASLADLVAFDANNVIEGMEDVRSTRSALNKAMVRTAQARAQFSSQLAAYRKMM